MSYKDKYFSELKKRVDIYAQIYASSPFKVIVRLLYWNIKQIFVFGLNCIRLRRSNNPIQHKIDTVMAREKRWRFLLAIVARGGLGDCLMTWICAKKIISKFNVNPEDVLLVVERSVNSVRTLISDDIGDKVTVVSEGQFHIDRSAFVIDYNIDYPFVSKYDQEFFSRKESTFKSSPTAIHALMKYVSVLQKQQDDYLWLFSGQDRVFHQQKLMLIEGKQVYNSRDFHDLLGMETDPAFRAGKNIKLVKTDVLERNNLVTDRYITISRSTDTQITDGNTTKMWPVASYQRLISLIKQRFPNYKIVRIGKRDGCIFDGIDVDLAGRTTFDEMLILLKSSQLHIDIEGGMVHFRHYLCGKPSIVLFGPTSRLNRGYSENINIKANCCSCEYCEWLLGSKWFTFCPLTKTSCCKNLENLSADDVFLIMRQDRCLE